MNISLGGGSRRGTSVLAALVIVAVLGVVATGLNYFKTGSLAIVNPQSMTAQAVAAAPTALPTFATDPHATPLTQSNVTDQVCKAGFVNKVQAGKDSATLTKPSDSQTDCFKTTIKDTNGKDVPFTDALRKQKKTSDNQIQPLPDNCKQLKSNECEVVACPFAGDTNSKETQCWSLGKCDTNNPSSCAAINKIGSGAASASYVATYLSQTGDLEGFKAYASSAAGSDTLSNALTPTSASDLSAAKLSLQGQLGDVNAALNNCDANGKCTVTGTVAATSLGCTNGICNQSDLLQKQTLLNSNLSDIQSLNSASSLAYDTTKDPSSPDSLGGCPGSPDCPGRTPGQTFTNPTPAPAATTPDKAATGGGSGGSGSSGGGSNQSGGISASGVGSFLNGLLKGMGLSSNSTPAAGNTTPQAAGTCNTQYMCNGSTLYYRNNQCVDTPMQYCQYGCVSGGTTCATQQTNQYGVGSDGQACTQPQPQPASTSCTTGTWKSISASNGCPATSWQCVPTPVTPVSAPTAQLSCQPQIADVGMSVALSFACANSTTSTGGGFLTGGQLSGSVTAVIAAPPTGTNTATFSLGCTNTPTTGTAQTASAQCNVTVNSPSIVLIANPNSVDAGTASSIGWVTTGMQSCVVSSPTMGDFTAANAGYTNVNGVATTTALTADSVFQLSCQTLAGGIKTATTSVSVITSTE